MRNLVQNPEVNIGSATLSVTADGVEIKNDIGNPIPVDDAGGSLTVDSPELTSLDGKVPADLTVTATRLLVDGSGVTQPVSGTVATTVAVRTPTTTSVASSATSVTILAANANRRGISIANDSTSILRLSFATPATTANAFIVLPPGAFILLDQQMIVTGIIYGIWSAANGTAQVTEYV